MLNKQLEYLVFESLPSTSLFLKEKIGNSVFEHPIICRAKLQTAGYGQYGRKWQTHGENLTFSIAITCPNIDDALPFRVILPIYQFLKKYTQGLYLKWPNDIYTDKGKLSGVLMEVSKDSVGNKVMVIGIGVNTSKLATKNIRTDFVEIDDLDKAAVELCDSIAFSIADNQEDIKTLINKWQAADYFKLDERIFLQKEGRIQPAIYQGINNKGFASVLIDGQLESFASGRVSLRKKEEL